MPDYQYQGVDKAGKKVTGKLSVPSEGDLRMILRGQGIRPVRISKVAGMNRDIGSLLGGGGSNASVPLEVLVAFTRQLNVLITSGIPIVQGLEILGEQASNRTMKTVILTMKEKVATYKGTFSIDPSKKPKTIDVKFREGPEKGNTSLGIYELDGDDLKLCLSVTTKERPTEFSAKPKSGHGFEVL